MFQSKISALVLSIHRGSQILLLYKVAMNCGDVDTTNILKSELGEDALDIVLTRLSGVAYHMHGLSRASTVRGMKETAESLMESEDRAKGILDPSECYDCLLYTSPSPRD